MNDVMISGDTLKPMAKSGYYQDNEDGIWALLKLLPKGTYFWKHKTASVVWIKGDYIRGKDYLDRTINKYECNDFYDYNRTAYIKGSRIVYISKTF